MQFNLRKIVLFPLVLLLLTDLFSQETVEQKFLKGVQYYTEAGYQQALDEWMEIYNTGYRSAALAYNIGNACFKLNNIPGAILFYERARLLKPADEDINYNLGIARSLVVDRFEEIPELFFIRWFDFLALLIPTNGWAKISLAAFILFLLLLSLYIYSSKYHIKIIGFWTALFFLVLTLSSFTFTVRNKSLVYDNHKAIIFSPSVSGKSSPDASGTDLFVLHEGTTVTIEDEVGEWYEIRLSDGNKGWVSSNSLNII